MKALVPAALMAAFSLTPAQAQPACGPYHQIAANLKEKYGEHIVGQGMRDGDMVQIWASDTGTWSFLVISPQGTACLLAGEHFDLVETESGDSL